MQSFTYERAASAEQAAAAVAARPDAKFISGGTNLLDLMKLEIERPAHLVDISRLPLDRIEETAAGGLRVGAQVRNCDLAADPRVRSRYPMLTQALLAGASGQIRNKASTSGNLLQRTRCPYFYDRSMPCNKREPGSGCAALQGFNRMHAVLGASQACIAVHPSDMAVAMAGLDATIETISPGGGTRTIPIGDLHRLPEATPHVETVLGHGEMIAAVTLPAAAARPAGLPQGARPCLLRLRAGIGGGSRREKRRSYPKRSDRHGRRGRQALARDGGRAHPRWSGGVRRRLYRRGRSRARRSRRIWRQ